MLDKRSPVRPEVIEHVIVYRREDEYAGWPFNGGLWSFDKKEFLVGFNKNSYSYDKIEDISVIHAKVQLGEGQHVLLRSKDGGKTWPSSSLQVLVKSKSELRRQISWYSHQDSPLPKPGSIDPKNPDFALASETPIGVRENGSTAYFVTSDRGYNWEGPHLLHDPSFETIQARPSYIIRANGELMWFVQGTRWDEFRRGEKPKAPEGRPMILLSKDGAKNWYFLSYITQDYTMPPKICPEPLMMPDGKIIVALRNQWCNPALHWTDTYVSNDKGLTWSFHSRVNDWGAPASLLLLDNGRLLCTYGYRVHPFGIRAKVSEDGGKTWGPEIILRDDGGSLDLGYPRTFLRRDGKVTAVYYMNIVDDRVNCKGGVRHIAATIFEVP